MIKGLDLLHEQLEKHRECLKDVDESIKRLTGRDQKTDADGATGDSLKKDDAKTEENNENRIVVLKRQVTSNGERNRNRRDLANDINRNRPLKRRHDDLRPRDHRKRSKSSDRDSEDDEPKNKHVLQSSVISKQAVIKTKEDLIKLQNKDTNSNQRNKRFFGMILGTLQKFKNDDKARSESSQAKQRKEIEKKIEDKEIEEKTKIKNEKSKLYEERKRQKIKIRKIQQKLNMVKELEDWEKAQSYFKHFIKTKTQPYIYYLPKIMDPETEKLLAESAAAIQEKINTKRSETEKEIEILTNSEKELDKNLDEHVENNNENSKFNKNLDDSDDSSTDSEMDDDHNDVKLGEDDEDDQNELIIESKKTTSNTKIEENLNNNNNNDSENKNNINNDSINETQNNENKIDNNSNIQQSESVNDHKSDDESDH